MLKWLINLVVFTIIGGLIGWTIGRLIGYTILAYDNYRLRRMMKRADKVVDDAFATINQWN